MDIHITPFSQDDVAFILKLPNEQVRRAVNTGILRKSACFSERPEADFCFPSFVDIYEFFLINTTNDWVLQGMKPKEFASYATNLICEYVDLGNLNDKYPFTDKEAISFLTFELESYLAENGCGAAVPAYLVFNWNNLLNLSIERIL